MTTVNMKQVQKSIPEGRGAVYTEMLSITAGSYSDAYLLPANAIYALGATITGSGAIEVTFDTVDAIEADSATWVAWDGSSLINLAVTAFRVSRTSGTVAVTFTVKTNNA